MKELAQKYKRQTASRYLPVGSDDITYKIIKSELYAVSPKYDGHFYLLSYDGTKVELINHGGNVITDLPLIKEAINLLKSKCKDVVIAGELYLNKEGERTRSFDMTAVLDEKSSDIHFAAFDMLTLDGEEMALDLKALDEKLSYLLKVSF